MEFKDTIKIEGVPSARVEQTTPKAICLQFEGGTTEWLPLSQLEVVSEKPIVEEGKNDQVMYICNIPKWLKDKIYIYVPEEDLEKVLQIDNEIGREVLSECCSATIHTDTDICSACLEHTGQ